MRIEMSQTSFAAQFYSNSSPVANVRQAAARTEPGEHHPHRRVQHDDGVSLSSGARELQRVKHEHDREEDPLRALDELTGKLLKSMLKAFTGREFNVVRPDAAGGAPGPASTAVAAIPTGATQPSTHTVPESDFGAPPSPPATSPFGNALAAYYQVQSFSLSFSASGTVSTEDGQQLGISVQFSFSQQFYSAMTTAGAPTRAEQDTADTPVRTDFQGIAAQLTQTSFHFELDFGGQPQPAVPGPVADTVPTQETAAVGSLPAAPNPVTTSREADNPFLEELDKLFEKLRVWMRQDDGSRQLIAYGVNSTTAVYLGSATAAADGGAVPPTADSSQEQTPVLDAVA